MKSSADSLPNLSRSLTWATALAYALLGAPLYVAPAWAVDKFLWNVTPFLAMTIGAWYLGAAFAAWRAASLWRWALIRPALIFLWAFGLLEAALLVIYRGSLHLGNGLAYAYVAALVLGSVSAIIGIADWVRTRPVSDDAGSPIPLWERTLVVAFVLFAGYISISLLTGAATGGTIWPGELTPLSARGFGAFYFAIALSGIPGLYTRNQSAYQAVVPFSVAGAALLLIPALVFIKKFDFQLQPGGLVYIGTYAAVIVIASAIFFIFRSKQPNQAAAR